MIKVIKLKKFCEFRPREPLIFQARYFVGILCIGAFTLTIYACIFKKLTLFVVSNFLSSLKTQLIHMRKSDVATWL